MAASIRAQLGGEHAFWKAPDYQEKTKKELEASRPPSTPAYTYREDYTVVRLAKAFFVTLSFAALIYSTVHFFAKRIVTLPTYTFPHTYRGWQFVKWTTPIALFKLVHAAAAIPILPCWIYKLAPSFIHPVNEWCNQWRAEALREGPVNEDSWVVKRISVDVDGTLVDAMMIGKPRTMENGRWALMSRGNGEFYEHEVSPKNPSTESSIYPLLEEIDGNAIIFNYPGVFGSGGFLPECWTTVKAMHAFLDFLKDKESGLGATEIYPKAHSIGAGVQGQGFVDYQFDPKIKYCAVKSRTFGDLGDIAEEFVSIPGVRTIVKLARWILSPVTSSKDLPIPEIVVQAGYKEGLRVDEHYFEITDASQVLHDGVISQRVALATALLNDPTTRRDNKYFMGMNIEGHMGHIDPKVLGPKMLEMADFPSKRPQEG